MFIVNDYIYTYTSIFKFYAKAIYTTENSRNQSFMKHSIIKKIRTKQFGNGFHISHASWFRVMCFLRWMHETEGDI